MEVFMQTSTRISATNLSARIHPGVGIKDKTHAQAAGFRKTHRRTALLCLAGIAFFTLFIAFPAGASDTYAAAVQVNSILVATKTGAGDPVAYPKPEEGAGEITVAEVLLQPGASTGWHIHAYPVYAYVAAGRLAVSYGNGTMRVFSPGEAIIEAVGMPHEGTAQPGETVRLIVFYTGIAGKPITFKVEAPK